MRIKYVVIKSSAENFDCLQLSLGDFAKSGLYRGKGSPFICPGGGVGWSAIYLVGKLLGEYEGGMFRRKMDAEKQSV